MYLRHLKKRWALSCYNKSPVYFCFLRGKHNRVVREYGITVRQCRIRHLQKRRYTIRGKNLLLIRNHKVVNKIEKKAPARMPFFYELLMTSQWPPLSGPTRLMMPSACKVTLGHYLSLAVAISNITFAPSFPETRPTHRRESRRQRSLSCFGSQCSPLQPFGQNSTEGHPRSR